MNALIEVGVDAYKSQEVMQVQAYAVPSIDIYEQYR